MLCALSKRVQLIEKVTRSVSLARTIKIDVCIRPSGKITLSECPKSSSGKTGCSSVHPKKYYGIKGTVRMSELGFGRPIEMSIHIFGRLDGQNFVR